MTTVTEPRQADGLGNNPGQRQQDGNTVHEVLEFCGLCGVVRVLLSWGAGANLSFDSGGS